MLFKNVIDTTGDFEDDAQAMEYADHICEVVLTADQHIGYYRHVGNTNGIEVYHDYAADYYFFVELDDA